MFRPSGVVRLGTLLNEMPAILALIDYLSNELLIIGRITFLTIQILNGTEDFLATVLSKLWPQMELKI